jgi:transposase
MLEETLCAALDRRKPNVARQLFEEWIAWATRSRLEPFQKAARTVRKYLDGIVEYVRTKLSNGRSEGRNSKVRTITKRSYGFHNASSLIAMIYLCCTGLLLVPVRHFPAVGLYAT